MVMRAAIITDLYIMGGAEAVGVAGGAAVAVGGMVGVAKFAHVSVPAHHIVVAGGEAASTVRSVGVGKPFAALDSAAGDSGHAGPGEFLRGGAPNKVNDEGTVFHTFRLH